MSSKTAAQRWGEQREHYLAIHGKSERRKEAPTVSELYPQYLSYLENDNKPSTAFAKKSEIGGSTKSAFQKSRRTTTSRLKEMEREKGFERL